MRVDCIWQRKAEVGELGGSQWHSGFGRDPAEFRVDHAPAESRSFHGTAEWASGKGC